MLGLENPASALCEAAASGDLSSVKRLIEHGVDPNSGDYDKRCALHIAAAEGQDKVVEFLLASKANPNVADRWGGTPMQDAVSNGKNTCANLIRSRGELPSCICKP